MITDLQVVIFIKYYICKYKTVELTTKVNRCRGILRVVKFICIDQSNYLKQFTIRTKSKKLSQQ